MGECGYNGGEHELIMKKKKYFTKWVFFFFLVVILLVAGILYNSQKQISGVFILGLDTDYAPNETLRGDLSFSMREGELLPADSRIIINLSGEVHDYPISEIISENKLTGDYYIENKDLTGFGEGYGISGKKEIYPNVDFVMKISYGEENAGEVSGEEVVETEPNEIIEEKEEEPIAEENVKQEKKEIKEEKQEGKKEEQAEAQSTESLLETSESSPESMETSGEESSELSPVTGEAISEQTFEVSGIVSKENPYTYNLEEGQTAEIISSTRDVTLVVEGGVVKITTNYYEEMEGFGEEFLGDYSYHLKVDISALNLKAKDGKMSVTLIYGDSEITSVSTMLDVSEPKKSVKSGEESKIREDLENASVKNITIIPEKLSDYDLTDDEMVVLKTKTGDSEAKVTESKIFDGRLIVKFEIGRYWLENSYDYDEENNNVIAEQIAIDRAKWLKQLAQVLSEPKKQAVNVENFTETYVLKNSGLEESAEENNAAAEESMNTSAVGQQ